MYNENKNQLVIQIVVKNNILEGYHQVSTERSANLIMSNLSSSFRSNLQFAHPSLYSSERTHYLTPSRNAVGGYC